MMIVASPPTDERRSSSPAASALFWYKHWSTTGLHYVALLVMVLLSVVSRQCLYGVLVVHQMLFPWVRLVHRRGPSDETTISRRGNNKPPPPPAREGGAAIQRRSPRRHNPPGITTETPKSIMSATLAPPSEGSQLEKKLIYLPGRPTTSRMLMIVALVHLVHSTLGGILIASVAFLRVRYVEHSSYFHLVGVWDPSTHWGMFAAQAVLLGILCGVQYMVTKRTQRILKAEARDDAVYLGIGTTTTRGGGGDFSPAAPASIVALSVADVPRTDVVNHLQSSTAVVTHPRKSTSSSKKRSTHRLTPGRTAMLAITTLLTAMMSPSFVSFVFLCLHVMLLATMLLTRRHAAKWMCLYWASLATLFAACVWILTVTVILSPAFGIIVGLPSAHFHASDDGGVVVVHTANSSTVAISPDAWLYVLGPSALPAFPAEPLSLSGNTTVPRDGEGIGSTWGETTWDPETFVSVWIVVTSLTALASASIARSNLGMWSVAFRWEDARNEASQTWKHQQTIQRTKALALVQRFTTAAAATATTSQRQWLSVDEREQLVLWVCQYVPLILIPMMWGVGCSIPNILSFGFLCIAFAGLALDVAVFMSVVPMLYAVCATAALMTYMVLLIRKTNTVRNTYGDASSTSSSTSSPFHGVTSPSLGSVHSSSSSGAVPAVDDLLTVFANALFYQDPDDTFTYTMVLLGVQMLALSALILARVVNKRAPTSSTYFHTHEKRHYLRTALASFSGTELSDLKSAFLRSVAAAGSRTDNGSNHARGSQSAHHHSSTFLHTKDGFRKMFQTLVANRLPALSDHPRPLQQLDDVSTRTTTVGGTNDDEPPHRRRFLGFLTEEDIAASWVSFVNGANVLLRREDSDDANRARLGLYNDYVRGTHRHQCDELGTAVASATTTTTTNNLVSLGNRQSFNAEMSESNPTMGLLQLSEFSAQKLLVDDEDDDDVGLRHPQEHDSLLVVVPAATMVAARHHNTSARRSISTHQLGSGTSDDDEDNFEYKLLEQQIFGTFVRHRHNNYRASVSSVGRQSCQGGDDDEQSFFIAGHRRQHDEDDSGSTLETEDAFRETTGGEHGDAVEMSDSSQQHSLYHEHTYSPTSSYHHSATPSGRTSRAADHAERSSVGDTELLPTSHYHRLDGHSTGAHATVRRSHPPTPTPITASQHQQQQQQSQPDNISKLFHAFSFFDFLVLEYFVRQYVSAYGGNPATTVTPQQYNKKSASSASSVKDSALFRYASLAVELVARHASTFALVGMFFAAVAENDLDVEQLVYVVLFVLLLCFPERLRVLWAVVACYAAVHISALFLFSLSYQHDAGGEAQLHRQFIVLRVIGISTTAPWSLTVYLVVMVCAAIEFRYSKAQRRQLQRSFPDIILTAQWKALLRCRCVAWVVYHLFQGLGGVTFLLVVILQRRSVLGAGYIIVYMISSAVGGIATPEQKRKSTASTHEDDDDDDSGITASSIVATTSPIFEKVRWVQAGYSIMALLLCSVFHLYGVNGWSADVMYSLDPSNCPREPDAQGLEGVLDCLAQLGFADYRQVKLLWSLGLWYVATVVHLAQVRSARSWDKAQSMCIAKVSAKLQRRASSSSLRQVRDSAASTIAFDVRQRHIVREVQRRCAVSRENFLWELSALEAQLFNVRVLTALKLMRSLCIAVMGLRAFARRHAYKALWVSLCVTGLYHPSITHVAFLVLFLLDLRGFWVIGLVSITLLQLYVYPLFVIPELPIDRGLAKFLGFEKTLLFALTFGQVNRDMIEFIPLVGCVLSAVIHRGAHQDSNEARREGHQRSSSRRNEHEQPLLASSPRGTSADASGGPDNLAVHYELFQRGSTHTTANTQESAVPESQAPVKRDLWFHLGSFAVYIMNDFWIDASYELAIAALLCAIGVGIERVTSACALVLLMVMLLIGRTVLVERKAVIVVLMCVTGLCALTLALLRVGLPASLYDASPFQLQDCGPWALYLGCSAPILDIAALLVVFLALKMMSLQVDIAVSRRLIKDNHVTFGSFLKSRSRQLSAAMADKAKSIADIFGDDIPHHITRNPRNLQEGFVMVCVFLPPTALLAFFVGALDPSILGVLDIILGLLLLAFKQRVVWRFYAFWPRVLQYLFIRLALEVAIHLPTARTGLAGSRSITKNIGIIPWADSSSSAACVAFLLGVFFAIVQHRIFNEFAFAGEIIAMHSKLLLAAEKHVSMMHRIAEEATNQQLIAQSQEEDIRSKLEELRRDRAVLIARAKSNGAQGDEDTNAAAAMHYTSNTSMLTDESSPMIPSPTLRAETGGDRNTLLRLSANSSSFATAHARRQSMTNRQFKVQQQLQQRHQHNATLGATSEAPTECDPAIREQQPSQRADSIVLAAAPTDDDSLHDDAHDATLTAADLTPAPPPPLVRQCDSVVLDEGHLMERRKSVFSFLLDDDESNSVEGSAEHGGEVTATPETAVRSQQQQHPSLISPVQITTPPAPRAAEGAVHQKSQRATVLQRKRGATRMSRVAALRQDVRDGFNFHVHQWIQSMTKMTYSGRPPNPDKSPIFQLLSVALRVLVRNSQYICFTLFCVNFAFSGALPDLLMCLSAMCYALSVNPWADALYWDGILLFNCVAIVLKAVMDTIIDESATPVATQRWISAFVVNTGVWDPLGSSQRDNAAIIDLALSFTVFAAVLVHRQWCIDRGVFGSSPLYAFHDTKSVAEDPNGSSPSIVLTQSSNSYDDDAQPLQQQQQPLIVVVSNSGDASPLISTEDLKTTTPAAKKKAVTYDGVQHFVSELWTNWTTRRGAGKDYYAPLATSQVLFIVMFVIMYFPLSGQLRGSIVEGITQDIVPGAAVMIVFALVLLMCIERVVYITSSIRAKVILHVVVVLLYCISYMVWNAVVTVYGSGRVSGAFLFLAGMLTCAISALQIREGFPLHRRHDPFTSSTSLPSYVGYTIYRVIPFCFELRLLLDWAFTKTALPLNDWLLLEDVHSEVYLRYVALKDGEKQRTHRGMSYSRSQKILKGFVGFAAILTILFFPLMYYSTYNPSLATNTVTDIKTTMTVHGITEVFQSPVRSVAIPEGYSDFLQLTRPRLAQFQLFKERHVQLLQNYRCSATTWSVPPTTKSNLRRVVRDAINNANRPSSSDNAGESLSLDVTIELTRQGSSAGNAKTQTTSFRYYLDVNQTLVSLIAALEGSAAVGRSGGGGGGVVDTATYNFSIPVPSFYSPFLVNKPNEVQNLGEFVGEGSDSQIVSANQLDCNLTLTNAYDGDTASRSEFWCLDCNTLFTSSNIPDLSDPARFPEDACLDGSNPSLCSTTYNFEVNHPNRTRQAMAFVVASDSVASSNEFLSNFGIIALYTTFILALGSVLRGAVTGSSHRVVVSDMYDPFLVAELLQFIYMARSAAARTAPAENRVVDAEGNEQQDDFDDDASEGGGGDINLALEEELYAELLDLLRNPDRVLIATGLHAEATQQLPEHRTYHARLQKQRTS